MKNRNLSRKLVALVALSAVLASGHHTVTAQRDGNNNAEEFIFGTRAGSSAAAFARRLALKAGRGRFSPRLSRLLERRADLFESGTWADATPGAGIQGESDAAPSQSALAARPAAMPPAFSFTDLGSLGPGFTGVTDMNERGQVVGEAGFDIGFPFLGSHPYLWDKGVITDLGAAEGALYSGAMKINNRGQVLGESVIFNDSGFVGIQPWVWENGVRTEISQPGNIEALDMNERGQVIGNIATGFSEVHSFIWDSGELTDLTFPGAVSDFVTSFAYDVNERSQVVGYSLVADSEFEVHAFLWDHGVLTDLGIPSPESVAGRINERGQIAGTWLSTDPFENRSFILTPTP